MLYKKYNGDDDINHVEQEEDKHIHIYKPSYIHNLPTVEGEESNNVNVPLLQLSCCLLPSSFADPLAFVSLLLIPGHNK